MFYCFVDEANIGLDLHRKQTFSGEGKDRGGEVTNFGGNKHVGMTSQTCYLMGEPLKVFCLCKKTLNTALLSFLKQSFRFCGTP